MKPLGERLPAFFGEILGVLRGRRSLAHGGAIFLQWHIAAAHAQNIEPVAQKAAGRQVIERRHELALGEIAGGAEDHQHAGLAARHAAAGDSHDRCGFNDGRHVCASLFAQQTVPIGVNEGAVGVVGALIGVRSEEIALRLRKVLRQAGAAIAVEVSQ